MANIHIKDIKEYQNEKGNENFSSKLKKIIKQNQEKIDSFTTKNAIKPAITTFVDEKYLGNREKLIENKTKGVFLTKILDSLDNGDLFNFFSKKIKLGEDTQGFLKEIINLNIGKNIDQYNYSFSNSGNDLIISLGGAIHGHKVYHLRFTLNGKMYSSMSLGNNNFIGNEFEFNSNFLKQQNKDNLNRAFEKNFNEQHEKELLTSELSDIIENLIKKLNKVVYKINLLNEYEDYKEFENFISKYSEENNIDINSFIESDIFKNAIGQIKYWYQEDLHGAIGDEDNFPGDFSYENIQKNDIFDELVKTLKEKVKK